MQRIFLIKVITLIAILLIVFKTVFSSYTTTECNSLLASNDESSTQLNKKEALQLFNEAVELYKLGQFEEAIEFFEKSDKLFEKERNKQMHGKIALYYGHICWKQKDYTEALKKYNEIEINYRKDDFKVIQAEAIQYKGLVNRDKGDHDKALQLLLKSLELAKTIKNDELIASSLNFIAGLHWKVGNYNQAQEYYEKSIEIRDKVNDHYSLALSHSNIGVLYKDMGNNKLALYHHNKALAIQSQLNETRDVAYTLNNIGSVYWKMSKPDSALLYYKQSLFLRKKLNNKIDMAKSYNNIGNAYKLKSNFKLALENYQTAYNLWNELDDKSLMAATLNKIGAVYLVMSKYHAALECYFKALDIYSNLNEVSNQANILNNVALIYKSLSNYEYAHKYHEQALEIYDNHGNKVHKAVTLNYLGNLFWKNSDLNKALNYYMQALRVREDIGDQSAVASSNNNLGLIYRDLGDSAKSISFYNSAYERYSNLNNERGMANVQNSIGDVYFQFNNYPKALLYFKKSLNLHKKLDNKRGVAVTSLNIGQLYIDKEQYAFAKSYITEALNIAFDINEGELIQSACYDGYMLYNGLQNHVKALQYYKLYSAQKDSMLNNENAKRMAELQVNFEIHERENQIENLKKQNEIDHLKLRFQHLLLIASLVGVILLILLVAQLFRSLKRRKETNKKLEQLFTVVAHDLRSPVSTLSNLSDLLNQPITELLETERETIIKHMDGITKSTVTLLDNLLSWSKKQQGVIAYDPDYINLKAALEENLAWMELMAKNKEVTIKNEIPDNVHAYVDSSALSLVYRNLIVNAIKFSHSKGSIRIFVNNINAKVEIGIEDNGVGMSSEKLLEVLSGNNNTSKKGTLNETGTGFGIRLCQEFIEINKGTLRAESIENKQTIFYFSLPINSPN